LPDNDLTKLLGWPGYRVYRYEINERAKTRKLWIRRKRRNRKLVCSGCGRKLKTAHDVSDDKFHVTQHACQAVDEMRRAEFFRKGGRMRGLVKGKHWLLLTRWVNLAAAGVVEAIKRNIKSLLRRGRGYKNLRYLLLKAQCRAATRTEFVVFKKAA
jgi:hypothetical protein